jgi:hypothetical protein
LICCYTKRREKTSSHCFFWCFFSVHYKEKIQTHYLL